MKKFGVLLCVMLCVPMFAFKANNEEQIILTVQYELTVSANRYHYSA